jgi:hypothetical protein
MLIGLLNQLIGFNILTSTENWYKFILMKIFQQDQIMEVVAQVGPLINVSVTYYKSRGDFLRINISSQHTE